MTITPETDLKLKFGLWGFVVGAGVAMIVGFNWGGWTTSSTTQKISQDAVMASHAAICVARFMNAPNFRVQATEFQKTESYSRAEIIEKGGWDRMPGQEKADWGVSTACVAGLETAIKPGA
jgi:hypothetical protein